MLSPKLKADIRKLWDRFWAGGIANPLSAIEQITYLIFLKRLEEMDDERQRAGQPADQSIYAGENGDTFRWSYIKQMPTEERPDHIRGPVFDWLKSQDGERMQDAVFLFNKPNADLLQQAVETIDRLFGRGQAVPGRSDDTLGDIYEELLFQIAEAGKNGQFRTPRHIIRFMCELLDIDLTHRVCDPACGTAGFLVNAYQHVLQKYTDREDLRLEADGSPHRLFGNKLSEAQDAALRMNRLSTAEGAPAMLVGYDFDRTMARLAWMNMVVHGIERPVIGLTDTLGKRFTERACYDRVLANPPYTGNVNRADLHESFPRNPRDNKESITDKTELLFVWRILDLLEPGGRAAVIVPEGLLFGSTTAHMTLRRELLFEHRVLAVISLPGGVFQPYTGVKTSILVFEKVEPERGKRPMTAAPYTEMVWFYEVMDEGFTRDQKRNPKPEPNDLWDAQEKWKLWQADPDAEVETRDYYAPTLYWERWRVVDDKTLDTFLADYPNLKAEQGQTRSIEELFGLPAAGKEAEAVVVEAQRPRIADVYRRYVAAAPSPLLGDPEQMSSVILGRRVRDVTGFFNDAMRDMLADAKEKEESWGRKALDSLLDEARRQVTENPPVRDTTIPADTDWRAEVNAIVREFAKLDGYDIQLRSVDVTLRTDALAETRTWLAEVRVLAEGGDGTLPDPNNLKIYSKNNIIEAEYLDPNCIEANDLNLSAGRYKPFTISKTPTRHPSEIIADLVRLEADITAGLLALGEKVAQVK